MSGLLSADNPTALRQTILTAGRGCVTGREEVHSQNAEVTEVDSFVVVEVGTAVVIGLALDTEEGDLELSQINEVDIAIATGVAFRLAAALHVLVPARTPPKAAAGYVRYCTAGVFVDYSASDFVDSDGDLGDVRPFDSE